VRASSEAETRSRGHLAPERGETYSRGRPSLERGGVPSVWGRAPRAKRSLARGRLGPTVLVGRWPPRTAGPCLRSVIVLGVSFVGEFVYVSLFAKESGFSLVI
jgi:hypothetical protein